jgi:hypothetical protein
MTPTIRAKKITYLKNGEIKGQIKLSDNTITHFEIDKYGEWNQWGNYSKNLFVTVPLMEQLQRKKFELV